ncbi:MAG TPA: DUF2497 domain-containing protein [Rhodoblastus sp.]|nr:DUF2497 domain-containing protein [Rhodoblastus sp.]
MTATNASINPAPVPASVESERRAHEPSMEEILASIRKIIADDDALPLTRPSAPPRLFEAHVATFAPPAPIDEAPPAPASFAPAPAAPVVETPVIETPVVETLADESPEVETPATERAEVRLDEFEMASFAEVGRELSRLESPDEHVEADQGGDLRPAFDETSASLAAEDDDIEVSPVPHDEASDEPHAGDEPAHVSGASYLHAAGASGYAHPAPVDGGAILSAEANASVASAFQALSASVQMASAESIDRHVREMLRPMLKQWLDDNLPVMVERLVRAEIERVARGGR